MKGTTHTILVADDDQLDARLTKRAISSALPDAEIRTFEDGEQALNALNEAEEGDRLSLVLMDFRMPKLGCLDVLRSLARHELVEKVPFVLFSSSVGPTDVQKCLAEGVREYVEKPTDPDQYDAAVTDICRRYATVL
jgi:two-component system response regulator